ncbi:MAG: 2-dehydropantoate 2-reductase [Verrucomicrobiota bacterium]|jgi:2-dehydropantoate 2-reductase
MKIAILGCGALGSYYGARLCRAGQEVHFLLRSDYEAVRRDGVHIQSVEGDFHVRPRCARSAGEIGPADLVLIGLKTTANGALPELLPPLVGPATAVLTLQNGLGNEALIASLAGPEKTLGGLCFVCLNRVAPGQIHHIAHGNVVVGEFARPAQARTHQIAGLLAQSGVACAVSENLEQAHWEKLVWNIPFNGLGVASCAGVEAVRRGRIDPGEKRGPCLTTDRLLADPRWAQLVGELMLETIRTAQSLGLAVAGSEAQRNIDRTLRMGAYKASTLLDFERGRELELEALFLAPQRAARRAGIATPRLSALCAILQQLATVQPGENRER